MKEQGHCGRIMLAATGSGRGKTTITCGLLQSMLNRGKKVQAFKCGPDYIDAMFHERVLGVPCSNLDSFLEDRETLRYLAADHTKDNDIALIEGAMGYYDGVGFSETASSYEIAVITDTPVILLVNAKGMSQSALAVLQGFLNFRRDSRIRGVIFNQMSERQYRLAKPVAEGMGIRVFGYVPDQRALTLQSRHLGLVTAREVENFRGNVQALSDLMEKTLDLDGILELAGEAPPLADGREPSDLVACRHARSYSADGPLKIGVARDAAFCFLYSDNMDFLKKAGCEICPVSPLADEALPEELDALILNGGYPELYAKRLSENKSFIASLQKALDRGLPCIAECGGFLYLMEALEDDNGDSYPMCNVIAQKGYRTGRLQRFGYLSMTADRDGLLAEAGETIRAHEFHYWDCANPGRAFTVGKPGDGRSWEECYMTPTLYAGFPHIYLYGNRRAGYHFLEAASKYREQDKCLRFEIHKAKRR